MIVRVTTHHIALGSRKSHFHNPIALAVQDAFTDNFAVVTAEKAHCVNRGIFSLPYVAQSWLREYNAGRGVSRFSFTVY